MAKRRRPRPTETCPHCGEDFPAGRAACPHCGSDYETGWAGSEEIEYQSVEIPDFYEDAAPEPGRNVKRAAMAAGMGLALIAAAKLAGLI